MAYEDQGMRWAGLNGAHIIGRSAIQYVCHCEAKLTASGSRKAFTRISPLLPTIKAAITLIPFKTVSVSVLQYIQTGIIILYLLMSKYHPLFRSVNGWRMILLCSLDHQIHCF